MVRSFCQEQIFQPSKRPSTHLIPVGFPATARTWAIMSSRLLASCTSGWLLGPMEGSPTGMPRPADFLCHFKVGKIPPLAGFCPLAELDLAILTGMCRNFASLSSSRSPS